MNYRKLSTQEIDQLTQQGCMADDWQQVMVTPDFSTDYVHSVKFTGINKIGKFEEEFVLHGGVKKHAGIYNAWIHNCTVGNNVLIHAVRDYIANYNIEDGAAIFDVKLLAVDGETTFGNGIKVECISELGTRSIAIYNNLSAQLAYILATYRHRPVLIENIEKLIQEYAATQKSTMGRVARNAKIFRCDTIINVNVGESALIEGARSLRNGTVNSEEKDPVYIGDGCHMENFIICAGSSVNNSTLVSNCFIGQGCVLDKHYSAVQSVFFANCQGFHGEATSIFAGPYTVTHHKSTLLIAGLYSFMNAGSGSNQSNHLYKLGPIHHGLLERGTKTTSDSYILWPSHVGAFTLVMGRHYGHSDTADFPFSYLIEYKDKSYLAPAVNLRSIGTIRDSQKWPRRDKRKTSQMLDNINYNLLSPYTVGKMIKGRDLLSDMQEKEDSRTLYHYQGVEIEARVLSRSIKLYEYAIWKFLGNSLISRLEKTDAPLTEKNIRKALQKDVETGSGAWVDIAGLLCPDSLLSALLNNLEARQVHELETINATFRDFHAHYYTYEWTWAYDVLEAFYGKRPDLFTTDDVEKIVNKWMDCVLTIDNMIYHDAKKELLLKKARFEEKDTEEDIESVSVSSQTNETILAIKKHMEVKKALHDSILERIYAPNNDRTK